MPRRRAQTRAAFAQIDFLRGQQPLVGAEAALVESLVPGTKVTRYDRVWHMARFSREDGWIHGRIGFERADQGPMWNEAEQDFVEATVLQAQAVPFVIDVPTMRMAFQLRGTTIKPGTFRGNFQGLLNEARPSYRWVVRLEGVQQPPWEEWREIVSRVIELRVHMEKPNPRYPGREVENLFEQSKAAAADLVLKAPENGDINLDAEFVLQAIQLAQEHGRIAATGVVEEEGQLRKEPWRSTLEGAVATESVRANPETGEALPEGLREALRGETSETTEEEQ